MSFSPDDIQRNRDFFADKLRAMKQKTDVEHWAKEAPSAGDFLLLDVRPRAAFRKRHIAGALCLPSTEIRALAPHLPRERELVVYCWSHF